MGYKLKELRTAANLTQAELASRAGVSRAIISGMESGRVEITTTKTLRKLANALDVNLKEIFLP